MKVILYILCFFSISSVTWGEVSLSIFESDGMTPFDFRDIYIGTTLKCIVRSDADKYWDGSVYLTQSDRNMGVLSDAVCLPSAGKNSFASPWEDGFYSGFDLYTDPYPAVGDWFMITYTALAVGSPAINLFEFDDTGIQFPLDSQLIHQIPEPTASLLFGLGSIFSLYFRRPSKG